MSVLCQCSILYLKIRLSFAFRQSCYKTKSIFWINLRISDVIRMEYIAFVWFYLKRVKHFQNKLSKFRNCCVIILVQVYFMLSSIKHDSFFFVFSKSYLFFSTHFHMFVVPHKFTDAVVSTLKRKTKCNNSSRLSRT